MPLLSLGMAAKVSGLGKTTLARAIKRGALSATRREDGSYLIDPAELTRFTDTRPETPATASQSGYAGHLATRFDATPGEPRDSEVAARLAAAEAEIAGLKALLAEVRTSRDEWQTQAQRLALSPPIVTPPPPKEPAPESPRAVSVPTVLVQRRSWLPWRRAG